MAGISAPTNGNFSPLIDVSTTQQFMRTVGENTILRKKLFRKLKEQGVLSADASGKYIEKVVRVGNRSLTQRGDLADRSFERKNEWVTYAIPYTDFEVLGVLSEKDLRFNRGAEAIVKLNDALMKNMVADFAKGLNAQILRTNAGSNTVLGIAATAATPVPMFGLPTIFGAGSGTVQNYNPDTQATTGNVAAADREALPNQSYCGISTHPTNAISGVDGKVNESTSPVLGNWSSTAWTGNATWASTGIKFCDHMLTRLARGTDPTEQVDLILCTRSMFTDFSNAITSGGPSGLGARVVLTNEASKPNLRVGDGMSLPYGNADICWDPDVPANVSYFLNTHQMILPYFPAQPVLLDPLLKNSGGEEMFDIKTQYDINQGAHKAVAIFTSQFWANPFFQGVGYNFA